MPHVAFLIVDEVSMAPKEMMELLFSHHGVYVICLGDPFPLPPIDIQKIIDFVDRFTMQPMEIRESVKHLTWKIQMQKVVESINIT